VPFVAAPFNSLHPKLKCAARPSWCQT